MKAITYYTYGPPDVLKLEDLPKPVPAADEVLVKVRASSVNPYDRYFMRGVPYPLRTAAGLGKPKIPRLGADLAGQVEAVGKDVANLKPGDDVVGLSKGSFAEYVSTSAAKLIVKPAGVTFEQAASLPIAGFTALQGLRDVGRIRAGQKVLVNGAVGGVGSFAVQIAKSYGADVTAVCSTAKLELARSLGADRVIDYTKDDFTAGPQRYDLIFDAAGNHEISRLKRALNPNGICVGAGGTTDKWALRPISRALAQLALSKFGSRKLVGVLAKFNAQDLATLCDLILAGKLTPLIDRRYPLSQVPDAIRYLEQGHARGKIIIAVP
jgi:NADPH:quinone reductase-like Zn-dependent oxidoreductase